MTTSRPNPGPIKTVHISNCMFNLTTGAHKLHKEFVKMKAGAYYYQPQTQLNDKEVICDDMKGAMTLNVDDDMITTWYTRDFPNWLNGLTHSRVKAIAGDHVEDAVYVVSLNGTAGKVIDIDSPVNVVKRLRQTLLMRAGASMDLLALDQCAVLDVEMKMDRGEIPTRVYGGNLQSQPPPARASHNISAPATTRPAPPPTSAARRGPAASWRRSRTRYATCPPRWLLSSRPRASSWRLWPRSRGLCVS